MSTPVGLTTPGLARQLDDALGAVVRVRNGNPLERAAAGVERVLCVRLAVET